jgi:transcriptional regulator with XRE-family HTH domain
VSDDTVDAVDAAVVAEVGVTHPRRLALEHAIVDDGRRDQEVAQQAGISPSWFSLIKSGKVQPRPATRRRIAAVLGVPEHTIFPEFAAEAEVAS